MLKFTHWTPLAAAAAVCSAAHAQQAPTVVIGKYFVNIPGSAIQRANNTTTYAANQTWCSQTATTVCVPGTVQIAATNGSSQIINRVTMLKSGVTTTNANFTIWFFSATPGTTVPNQFDATAYSGPRAADLPNYIGNAACATPIATSDTTASVWFECTLSNPNTAGAIAAISVPTGRTLNYLISVTAAYAPAANETLTPYVSGFY